ncbi:MAG: hypothetical protein LN568_02765 [Rickettsia endosymbiont of Pseudomimeciton antennatum]|nr:hypothetical protein [Rickettsia endosymbiont of Pseudomimeciton antennatum]
MTTDYKCIKILTEAEIHDLYALPKFTLCKRIVFFTLNKRGVRERAMRTLLHL